MAHTDMPGTFAKNRSQWSVHDAMLYCFNSTTQVENAQSRCSNTKTGRYMLKATEP